MLDDQGYFLDAPERFAKFNSNPQSPNRRDGREYLPGPGWPRPGESFPQMFLSTSGLDSIDGTLVHTNKTPCQSCRYGYIGWVHTASGNRRRAALQMPDLTASTAPTGIGCSALGTSFLLPHNGHMGLQFFPFWALQMVPASPDRAESCACGGRCNPPPLLSSGPPLLGCKRQLNSVPGDREYSERRGLSGLGLLRLPRQMEGRLGGL